jgi:hypothetical protein
MRFRIALASSAAVAAMCALTAGPASAAPDQFTQEALTPNNFNADQHSDPAVFRPASGNWYISGDPYPTHYGTPGDIPAVWNEGYGLAHIGVFRPSTGKWYLANFAGETKYAVHYGTRGDIPVQAHYRGIDKATVLAVYRPSKSTWYVRGVGAARYGGRYDVPVPGHYFKAANDDYADHIAVFRPYNGNWYIRGHAKIHYGTRGDIPVTGDFNGDGKGDIAVFRPSTGSLYIRGAGSERIGRSGDFPIGKAPYRD